MLGLLEHDPDLYLDEIMEQLCHKFIVGIIVVYNLNSISVNKDHL